MGRDLAEPFIQDDAPMFKPTKRCYKCCCCSCCIILLLVAIVFIVEGALYWTALLDCTPEDLNDYSFPGGGTSVLGPAFYNMVPKQSFLVTDPGWFTGSAKVSEWGGDQVGTVNKLWGPVFFTYTYQDVAGKTTWYMRRNLGRLGKSHRIQRCDGRGPDVWVEEGTDWFGNEFMKVFHGKHNKKYKVYSNDRVVGTMEINSHKYSLRFCQQIHGSNLETCKEMASAKLANVSTQEGWDVQNKPKTILPYWAVVGATSLVAFETGK